ncbi:protein Mo25-like [Lytechinus variegatus]|uniref:protein Mo25-like n=1 Tax=Lytechinus variegatus TaxID=7654 RepID=UPI001BB2C80A|nr:protein Mo25-like [Lytechinus variegatus]
MHYESLAKIVLFAPEFFELFKYIVMPKTDIAADAFATFKILLTRHQLLASMFLEENYDRFTEDFTNYFLKSDRYETKKNGIDFLGELLLNRHNYNFMTRYIGNVENLELIMQMLKDRRIRGIQLGAFNVFKVFVANPEKTPPVHDLLLKNKDDLVEFLTEFYSTDEQFNYERSVIIQSLRALQP